MHPALYVGLLLILDFFIIVGIFLVIILVAGFIGGLASKLEAWRSELEQSRRDDASLHQFSRLSFQK